MIKTTQEHTTCDNLVNRIFKTIIPYNILLIDITYLFYENNKKCYLSTIKDAETKEILAYYISENMTLDISLETIKKLHRKRKLMLSEKVIIHSELGVKTKMRMIVQGLFPVWWAKRDLKKMI